MKRPGFARPKRCAEIPPGAQGVGALQDVLQGLAEALAPYLRDVLKERSSEPGPAFYSQSDSPLGRRRHLELARAGVLTGRTVGRRVLVLREDVHAYIDARRKFPVEFMGGGDFLADWGVHPRKAGQ